MGVFDIINKMVLDAQELVRANELDMYALLRSEVQIWRDILAVPCANFMSVVVPY